MESEFRIGDILSLCVESELVENSNYLDGNISSDEILSSMVKGEGESEVFR